MKEFSSDMIRNVGLVGHGGVGKTSLAEAALFSMGEIDRLGKVAEGTTVSDYHSDEIAKDFDYDFFTSWCMEGQ